MVVVAAVVPSAGFVVTSAGFVVSSAGLVIADVAEVGGGAGSAGGGGPASGALGICRLLRRPAMPGAPGGGAAPLELELLAVY